jgi:hypothetical protein
MEYAHYLSLLVNLQISLRRRWKELICIWKYVSGNTDMEMSTSRLHLSLPGNVDIDADEKEGNQLEPPALVALSLNIGAYERRK